MEPHDNAEESTGTKPRFARRGVLKGIGVGGLATAATVFGFAPAASARAVVACCRLCCTPGGHTVSDCEHGFYYVWTCTDAAGGTCYCCEHNSPCHYGCGPTHWSAYSCTK